MLVLLLSLCARGQKPFIRDYTLNEAGTSVKVNALGLDSIGYIWVGTDNGLFCFNGRSFQKIQDSVHKPVEAIAISGDKVVAGFNNGKIGEVAEGVLRELHLDSGLTSVTSLCFTQHDSLWVGTETRGLYVAPCCAARALTPVNGNGDQSVDALYPSGSSLWASFGGTLAKVSAHSNVIWNSNLKDSGGRVSAIRCIAGTPYYLLGTVGNGVALFNSAGNTLTPLGAGKKKWAYGRVNDMLPVSDKRAWVATEGGYLVEIVIKDSMNAELHSYHYPGKSFRKLLIDKAGNIWCGTSQGVTMTTGEYLSAIRLVPPYSLHDVTAMLWNDDVLWVALKKSLYRVCMADTPGMECAYTARADISCLYGDAEKRLWVGTLGDGLFYMRGKSKLQKAPGPYAADSRDILNISGEGDHMWVAGSKGVDELLVSPDGKISLARHFDEKTGLGSDFVHQIYPDRSGNLWMATDGAGVCMYDGAAYHHWDSNFVSDSKVAFSITQDTSGDMWVGTLYKDLFHYHDNKWENMRRPETQYPDINITTVMANATGQVISVYQRCIDEWYPKSKYFRHFNSALGLGIDTTSTTLNCAARDKNGNIYIPYQQGILVFRSQAETYDIRPGIHIRYPTIFSRPVPGGRRRFDYDENYVGFAFDGLGSVNHERFNYRYVLEGYDDKWVYTNDASVIFPRLPSGNYKFRVQASLNPAFEHPTEDFFEFSIATPFWRTLWFYLLLCGLAFSLGLAYVKSREKGLRRIAQLQQERMMFEYEHLKSQVNPHFLFNSLYVLSILIEEKKDNALSYTVHLADLYRNMLASVKKNLIYVREEMEILTNYISIQQTRFGSALEVRIDIAAEIMDTRQIVPLATQLLVENAIKHNVVSASAPLVISISATKDVLTVSNVLQPKISKDKGEGIGLSNIRKRYALLTRKPVIYGIFENEFVVTLPLL